jgi:hypothetical protein
MLQAAPHGIQLKRILSFGEGQGSQLAENEDLFNAACFEA